MRRNPRASLGELGPWRPSRPRALAVVVAGALATGLIGCGGDGESDAKCEGNVVTCLFIDGSQEAHDVGEDATRDTLGETPTIPTE